MAQSDWQLLAVAIPFHSKNAIGEVTVCIGRDFYQIKWMREQYFGRCQWQLLLSYQLALASLWPRVATDDLNAQRTTWSGGNAEGSESDQLS